MSRREQWLQEAVSELLEIEASGISVSRPLYEQGVDSLIGLRLTRKLEDLLGVEVELEWLFDHPSIEELSRFLDERFGEPAAAAAQPERDHGFSA